MTTVWLPRSAFHDDMALEADIRAAVSVEFGFIPDPSEQLTAPSASLEYFESRRPSEEPEYRLPLASGWFWRGAEDDLFLKFTFHGAEVLVKLRTRRGKCVYELFATQSAKCRRLLRKEGANRVEGWREVLRSLRSSRRRNSPMFSNALGAELHRRGAPL